MTDVITEVAESPVEEYLHGPKPEPLHHNERAVVATRLGLHSQTVQRPLGDTLPVRRTALRALQHYEELEGLRLTAWRKFFPTVYGPRRWKEYRFDVIPLRALKAIEAAKESGMFDRIEIWTPEPVQLRSARQRAMDRYDAWLDDPVAVGWVDNRAFPIVRWGADELVSNRRIMRVGLSRAFRDLLFGRK